MVFVMCYFFRRIIVFILFCFKYIYSFFRLSISVFNVKKSIMNKEEGLFLIIWSVFFYKFFSRVVNDVQFILQLYNELYLFLGFFSVVIYQIFGMCVNFFMLFFVLYFKELVVYVNEVKVLSLIFYGYKGLFFFCLDV